MCKYIVVCFVVCNFARLEILELGFFGDGIKAHYKYIIIIITNISYYNINKSFWKVLVFKFKKLVHCIKMIHQ